MKAISAKQEVKTLAPVTEPIIKAEDICFSYSGKPVLNHLDFELEENGHLLVCGPNGSGKTTLLRLILGMLHPQSGRLVKKPGLTISYCKQDFPNLDFPINAAEVVRMGLYGQKEASPERRVRQAMERTNCLHLSDRLFSSLSGGERQRVSLARCFCQKAQLLLLDEPSSFLDTESRDTLVNLLSGFRQDEFAVIAVTHDRAMLNALGWRCLNLEA